LPGHGTTTGSLRSRTSVCWQALQSTKGLLP
jgi:hypothetical protein